MQAGGATSALLQSRGPPVSALTSCGDARLHLVYTLGPPALRIVPPAHLQSATHTPRARSRTPQLLTPPLTLSYKLLAKAYPYMARRLLTDPAPELRGSFEELVFQVGRGEPTAPGNWGRLRRLRRAAQGRGPVGRRDGIDGLRGRGCSAKNLYIIASAVAVAQ
jgi:hypothetical protein